MKRCKVIKGRLRTGGKVHRKGEIVDLQSKDAESMVSMGVVIVIGAKEPEEVTEPEEVEKPKRAKKSGNKRKAKK